MNQIRKNGKVLFLAVCSRCRKRHFFPTYHEQWTCDFCVTQIKAEKQAAIEEEKKMHARLQEAKQNMAASLAPRPIKVWTQEELSVREERDSYLPVKVVKRDNPLPIVATPTYVPRYLLSLEDMAPRNFKQHHAPWRLNIWGAINESLEEIKAARDILTLRRRRKFFRHLKKNDYSTKGKEWELHCMDPDAKPLFENYPPKDRGNILTAEELIALQLRTKSMNDATPHNPVFDHMEAWRPSTKYEYRMAFRMYHAVQEKHGYKAAGKYDKYIHNRLWIFDGEVYDRKYTPKKVWKEFFRRYDPLYPKDYEEDPQEFTPFGIDLGSYWDSEDRRRDQDVLIPNGTYQHDTYEAKENPYAFNPNRGEIWYEELVSEESYMADVYAPKSTGNKDYPIMLRRFFRLAAEHVINRKFSLPYEEDGDTPKPLDIMRRWNSVLPDNINLPDKIPSEAVREVRDWVLSLRSTSVKHLLDMARKEFVLAQGMGGFFPALMKLVGTELRIRLDSLSYESMMEALVSDEETKSKYFGDK